MNIKAENVFLHGGSGDIEQKLSNFFDQIKFQLEILQDQRAKMNLYLAQQFNVMKYIRPDENRLSEIISDFLNPKGDHGQGNLFLSEFLKKVGLKLPELEELLGGEVKVTREKTTNLISEQAGRMDVLVEFTPSKFSLVIENKPWAGEQENQVQRYVNYLQILSKGDFRFVYLSGKGEPPTSIPKESYESLRKSGKFFTFSYRHDCCEWLKLSKAKCQAEKVRIFVQDLIDFVEGDDSFSIEM